MGRLFTIIAAQMLAVSPALSSVIDFEDVPVGPIAGDSLTIVRDGVSVTFAGLGLRIRQFDEPYPNTRVLSTSSDIEPITITFGGGVTSDFVEVENILNGRFSDEIDQIRGDAFDSASALLDSQSNFDTIHHLTGPAIARVVYDDVIDGDGYLLDNFTFTPEPASLVLLAVGALRLVRRRG